MNTSETTNPNALILGPITQRTAKLFSVRLNSLAKELGAKLAVRRRKRRRGQTPITHQGELHELERKIQALMWAADHLSGVPHATIITDVVEPIEEKGAEIQL